MRHRSSAVLSSGLVSSGLVSSGLVIALATRLLLAVLGLAALVVPLPGPRGLPAVLALIAAPAPFLVARWPDSPWVSGLLTVCLVEWVGSSLIDGLPPVGLTLAFGCLLYLVHTLAALAAAVPVTRRVEPTVLARLAVRLLGVLAGSVPVMLLVLVAPRRPGSALLGLAGVVAAVGVGVVLVVLLHRPGAGDPAPRRPAAGSAP